MNQKLKTNSALKSADGQGKIVTTQDKLERWRQHFESVLSIQTTVSEVTLDNLKGCAEAGGCPEANSEFVDDGLVCPPMAEEVAEARVLSRNGFLGGDGRVRCTLGLRSSPPGKC